MRFRSADQAVRFCFRMRDRAEYARVNFGSRGRGHGLSPLELHGEAAIILSRVNSLPVDQRACVFARYSTGDERIANARTLGLALRGTISVPDNALEPCILNWSTSQPPLRVIAKRLSVSYRKVYEWKVQVERACTSAHARALANLDGVLFQPDGYDKVL